MKVKLDYNSLSLWQVIASYFPFKSKKYIAKWTRWRKDRFNCVEVWCDEDGVLRADIQLDRNVSTMLDWLNLCRLTLTICKGISMRDLWDNLLKRIALYENMRNTEELCIWLDMCNLSN